MDNLTVVSSLSFFHVLSSPQLKSYELITLETTVMKTPAVMTPAMLGEVSTVLVSPPSAMAMSNTTAEDLVPLLSTRVGAGTLCRAARIASVSPQVNGQAHSQSARVSCTLTCPDSHPIVLYKHSVLKILFCIVFIFTLRIRQNTDDRTDLAALFSNSDR